MHSKRDKFTEQFIEMLEGVLKRKIHDFDIFRWEQVSDLQCPEAFLDRYKYELNWTKLSQKRTFEEREIRKYKHYVDWDRISRFQDLSEAFIDEFEDRLNWEALSLSNPLTEKQIEKHKDEVNWDWISAEQELSEPFIESHSTRVNWPFIFRHQDLSYTFIIRNSDKLFSHQMEFLMDNEKINLTEEQVEELMNIVNLSKNFG